MSDLVKRCSSNLNQISTDSAQFQKPVPSRDFEGSTLQQTAGFEAQLGLKEGGPPICRKLNIAFASRLGKSRIKK